MSVGPGWSELTSRESAVLAAVERRLTNAEIADELFISVRTVESHIAALRRKLGVGTRIALIEAARARRGRAVQVPQNSFLGREADVAAVRDLVRRHRWVTLVGPAGAGKTRLALEIAAVDERTPVVAELEQASAEDVIGVLARSIGVTGADPDRVLAACAVALDTGRHLLVIDNSDRVTDVVGRAVGILLATAHSLTVLTTSRWPVGDPVEAVYEVAPLPVDEAAVAQLFRDRAAASAPTVRFTSDDDDAIARICRRLDGLPLAIELAAARVRHLSPAELADRLDSGFGALAGTAATERHRTLETAFDWTWDLLDGEEQSVLARLAALPGTFDLDLAEAVTAPDAAGVVLRLVDRSLVARAGPEVPARFRLLDSLRAFALGRADPAIVPEVRLGHAAHHADLGGRLAGRAHLDSSRAATEAAVRLYPELVFAIEWAVDAEHRLAVPLIRNLSVLVEQYGPTYDSLDAVDRALRRPELQAVMTATDLVVVGRALFYGDLDLVGDLTELAMGRADDESSRCAALFMKGTYEAYRQRGAVALPYLAAAEELAGQQDDPWLLGSIRQVRGIALRAADLADYDSSLTAYQSSLQSFAEAGDAMHVNNVRYMMAAVVAESGRSTRQAIDWAEECAEFARESGNRQELAHALLTRDRAGSR